MLSSRRYLYVVFLCHLALEKALKAAVAEATAQYAPKVHDLVYLVKRAGLTLPTQHLEFVSKLNNARIATGYPEDLREALKEYDRTLASSYLKQTEEVLAWLKTNPMLTE